MSASTFAPLVPTGDSTMTKTGTIRSTQRGSIKNVHCKTKKAYIHAGIDTMSPTSTSKPSKKHSNKRKIVHVSDDDDKAGSSSKSRNECSTITEKKCSHVVACLSSICTQTCDNTTRKALLGRATEIRDAMAEEREEQGEEKSNRRVHVSSNEIMENLEAACRAGSIEFVRYFALNGGYQALARTNNGENKDDKLMKLFQDVVAYGHMEVVFYLMRVFQITIDLEGSADFMSLALRKSVGTGDAKMASILMELGANPNESQPLQDGQTLLHVAARKANTHVVDVLIKSGANVHAQDIYGVTPLLTVFDCRDWVQDLESNHALVVCRLLAAGAGIHQAVNSRGDNILTYACDRGNLKVIQFLREEYNVDLDQRNFNGDNALTLACSSPTSNLDVIEYLLDQGAEDIPCGNKKGENALLAAVSSPKPRSLKNEVVNLLLRKRVSSWQLQTPLAATTGS